MASDPDSAYGLDGLVVVSDAGSPAPARPWIQRAAPLASSLVVVFARHADEAPSESDRTSFNELIAPLDPPHPRYAEVVPEYALAALEAMRAGSADTFATQFAASNMGELSDALHFTAPTASPQRSAVMLASQAVASSLSQATDEAALLAEARDRVAAFESASNERRAQTRSNILRAGAPPPEDVQQARAALDRAMQTRLAWYKLPLGRIDDVAVFLVQTLEATFLRRYETQLTFEAGQLSALRMRSADDTDKLLASPPFSASLHSEVLLNSLEQLDRLPSTSSLSSHSAPDLLSRPIALRRSQLAAPGGPIEHLQRKAQSALLGSAVIALAGPATSYMAFMSGSALASTSAALAVASVTVAAWVLQRGWAKAQRRFLANVDRVLLGLGYDLHSGVDATLDEVVLAKPRMATRLLLDLIAERQSALDESIKTVRSLQSRTNELRRRILDQSNLA